MTMRPAAMTRRPAAVPKRSAAMTRRSAAHLAVALVVGLLAGCATPQWPVKGPVSSPYGLRMMGGILPDLHRGVDIAAAVGTPVRPLLAGRVRFAGTMSGYGRVIWIDHSDDLLSLYAHLSEIAVSEGQEVSKSTVLGKTGQSGNVTGPHLHLEVWRWGREVDPVQLLGGPPGT